MTVSNMISVIVAICFVVFIGLSNTSLLYYAAQQSDSVQGKRRRTGHLFVSKSRHIPGRGNLGSRGDCTLKRTPRRAATRNHADPSRDCGHDGKAAIPMRTHAQHCTPGNQSVPTEFAHTCREQAWLFHSGGNQGLRPRAGAAVKQIVRGFQVTCHEDWRHALPQR